MLGEHFKLFLYSCYFASSIKAIFVFHQHFYFKISGQYNFCDKLVIGLCVGSIHFADLQSMDCHDGIPNWTTLNNLPCKREKKKKKKKRLLKLGCFDRMSYWSAVLQVHSNQNFKVSLDASLLGQLFIFPTVFQPWALSSDIEAPGKGFIY